jgi:hypothetical protein
MLLTLPHWPLVEYLYLKVRASTVWPGTTCRGVASVRVGGGEVESGLGEKGVSNVKGGEGLVKRGWATGRVLVKVRASTA